MLPLLIHASAVHGPPIPKLGSLAGLVQHAEACSCCSIVMDRRSCFKRWAAPPINFLVILLVCIWNYIHYLSCRIIYSRPLKIEIYVMIECQTFKVDSWWHVVGWWIDLRPWVVITHDLRFGRSWQYLDVRTRRISIPNSTDDRHDQSLREIALLGVTLSVFFTDRYSVLGGTRLVQRTIIVETWDLYWLGPLGSE